MEQNDINIRQLTTEVMEALAHTIDAKDKYTNGHSERVAIYSKMIARRLGLPQKDQDKAYYMGLLHDIGKAVDHEMEGSHQQDLEAHR